MIQEELDARKSPGSLMAAGQSLSAAAAAAAAATAATAAVFSGTRSPLPR